MGPSGSGKSTLLNILSLIDRPTSGTVKFDNKEINFSKSDINDKIRAKKIGIVYQQNNLLSDFTALENVYLSRLSIDNNKDKAVDVAKKIINSIGLLNRINHYPSQLSGGEMQRIAIARALVNEPEIIAAFTGPENAEPVKVATMESLIEIALVATFIPVPAPTFPIGQL